MSPSDNLPILAFPTAKAWETWLAKNQASSPGVWLKIFKKESARKTVTYAEAIIEALCYGWIDGQKKPLDKQAWLQKFSPRRAKSVWSKINTEHVARLMKEGRMKAAGLKTVEEAKADGRWGRAYDSPSKMTVPVDFLKELGKNKKGNVFFKTLNRANLYSIVWRLQTAKKQETRLKRIKTIVAMMAKGEKFH